VAINFNVALPSLPRSGLIENILKKKRTNFVPVKIKVGASQKYLG
jgi:hypothetical protein